KQPAAPVNPYLTSESVAETHNSAFRHKDGTVRHAHHIIGTDSHAACERQPAGQKRVTARAVERDLHGIALRIFAVSPIRHSERLRRVEIAVRPEGAVVSQRDTLTPDSYQF